MRLGFGVPLPHPAEDDGRPRKADARNALKFSRRMQKGNLINEEKNHAPARENTATLEKQCPRLSILTNAFSTRERGWNRDAVYDQGQVTAGGQPCLPPW